jgi:hypothetical protein
MQEQIRVCKCGKSSGLYHSDKLNASIMGGAIAIGIDNQALVDALKSWRRNDLTTDFRSFIIERPCMTVHHKK